MAITRAFFTKWQLDINRILSEYKIDVENSNTFVALGPFDLAQVKRLPTSIYYVPKDNSVVDERELAKAFSLECTDHDVVSNTVFLKYTEGVEKHIADSTILIPLKDINKNVIEICEKTSFSPKSLVIFVPDLLDLEHQGEQKLDIPANMIKKNKTFISLDLEKDTGPQYYSTMLLQRLENRHPETKPFVQETLKKLGRISVVNEEKSATGLPSNTPSSLSPDPIKIGFFKNKEMSSASIQTSPVLEGEDEYKDEEMQGQEEDLSTFKDEEFPDADSSAVSTPGSSLASSRSSSAAPSPRILGPAASSRRVTPQARSSPPERAASVSAPPKPSSK